MEGRERERLIFRIRERGNLEKKKTFKIQCDYALKNAYMSLVSSGLFGTCNEEPKNAILTAARCTHQILEAKLLSPEYKILLPSKKAFEFITERDVVKLGSNPSIKLRYFFHFCR